MLLAELSFGQTVASGAINTILTALLVAGAATFIIKRYESREADRRARAAAKEAKGRQEAEKVHDERLQSQQLEYQTRATLRETYSQLLVAQRKSREGSLELARQNASASEKYPSDAAVAAHDQFIDLYHRLNLDADDAMWRDARALRKVLDDLLKAAQQGSVVNCEGLVGTARDARQNLERSFRIRLGYPPLQKRRPLGKYDKSVSGSVQA
jgi:hypothetical protein